MVPMLIPLVGNSKLIDGWNALWGKVSSVSGDLFTYLAGFGALLVVGAIVTYLWQRRKSGGGGGGTSGLVITIIIGALLASPTLIIPGLLTVADWGLAVFVKLLP